MKVKNDLQKFTNSDSKIIKLMELEKPTLSDVEQLSSSEAERLYEILTEKLNSLKGTERDNFLEKFESITSQCTKNMLWDSNHIQITLAISNLMQEYGRMPTKTEIAIKTELSRQTIHKHLKEYTNHHLHLQHIEQFKFMTSKVLAKVFQLAVNGDMRAAKLYLNSVGTLHNKQTANNTLIQNQNNYIQINGTVLSQETVKHLNPEQLNAIELILKTTEPINGI